MGDATGIQWTHHTWNPWQGCARVSPGCDNCYMFRDMRRYGKNPDLVTLSSKQTFNKPLRWNREAKAAGEVRRVFVASWADFFGAEADEWRPAAWDIIKACDSLVFQVLTKRHGRIAHHLPPDWGPNGYPNVWLGVTAEDREWFDRRTRALVQVPAVVRFVSYEPAIGSIAGASAEGIDWMIVGGESGAKNPTAEFPARPFDLTWAREAIAIADMAGAAPFVKQLGSNAVEGGACYGTRDPHGGDPDEWPEDLRVRQWPEVRHG
jgi:protein gp37